MSMTGSAPQARSPQEQPTDAPMSVRDALGLGHTIPEGMTAGEYSRQVAEAVERRWQEGGDLPLPMGSGLPGLPGSMSARSPYSAAVLTSMYSHGSAFTELAALADWDGREDLTADRSQPIDHEDGDIHVTRTAISAHTVANGFNENVFYYADNFGNVIVGIDTDLDGITDDGIVINLPTSLNAFGTINSANDIVVTGLAVSPVVDLTSYPNVNGSFAPFAGKIGEVLYVSYWDTGSGLRLASNGTVIRSGVLAFPISDDPSPAVAPPGVISDVPLPVTVGGAFAVVFSVFSNLGGCAVDDDGSLYFHQVDLQQFTGGNIVKIRSVDTPQDVFTGDPPVLTTAAFQDRSLATSSFLPTITSLNPVSGNYGTSSGPVKQRNQGTNYSGTSTFFGNVVALATGPGDTLYAAVARSLVTTDDAATRAAEGLFSNPAALGPTPAMVITMADYSGNPPAPDDKADVVSPGATLVPGVNNFRAFVLGDGPDTRLAAGTSSPVFGTTSDTLKLHLQVDYTVYGGLMVDEEDKVFVVSGGTPAGIGRNPSPEDGAILVFPDREPSDRRADYVDLRGNLPPNPPASGGNVGDGDSDVYDHYFWSAPIDAMTATPQGVSGLSRGFLRYTNRLAPNMIDGLPLGNTDRVQGDDSTSGPITFETFDPGHQVAGGDDQTSPFRGDDSDGGGTPAVAGPLNGGFEFTFGGTVGGVCTTPWNAFYLNSNGSVSFSAGDTDNTPTAAELLAGAPRIAGAWADINPLSQAGGFGGTFPLQAIGFAGVNHFKVRWINVPRFDQGSASSNTFSISLFDDGTGLDENANQPLNPANPIGNNAVPFDLQEGPTDLRWYRAPDGTLIGRNVRRNGTGGFVLQYGRTDAFSASQPVLAGYSTGELAPGAVTEINLGETGRTAVIGNGTEVAIFEFFNAGDFDLRFESHDPALGATAGQADLNRERLEFFGKACTLPFPFVTATKTVSGTFNEGTAVTYSVVLTNHGTVAQPDNPAPNGNEFTDVLPAQLTLVSATATSGTAAANVGTNTATWSGSLAPGASVTITIGATINHGTGGATVSNQGTAAYAGTGGGLNDILTPTDDPSTVVVGDPTSFLVVGCPVITVGPVALPSGTTAGAYPATTLTAAGGTGPYTFAVTAGALPPGLALVGDVISGQPTQAGSFNVTVTATDANGCTGSQNYTVVILPAYLLSEGAIGPFFDTYVLVANPDPALSADVQFAFRREDGATATTTATVGPRSRYTLPLDSVGALGDGLPGVSATTVGVATTVTSLNGVGLVVEQSTYWQGDYRGGITSMASPRPSTTWYFGEGSEVLHDFGSGPVSYFDTYVLVDNANAVAANLTVTYLVEAGAPVVQGYTVPANSRYTIFAGALAGLVDRNFGMVVTSDQPVVVDRSMYFGPSYVGGHGSAGLPQASTTWQFAEGSTGAFFDLFLLLANPGGTDANVTATYYLSGGATVARIYTVPALGRKTVYVDGEPGLANDTMWIGLTSDQPIVAERSMYWPNLVGDWVEGHNAPGTTQAATKLGLAEGAVGGVMAFNTFVILANPNDTAATADLTFLKTDGTTVVKPVVVPALGRRTFWVNAEAPELVDEGFGVLITSTNAVPVLAERALYWLNFEGGSASAAVPVP